MTAYEPVSMQLGSDELQFRRAGPADAEAVRGLTRRAYAKWVPLIGREPKPMTVDYDSVVTEHQIDLLEAGSQAVGLIEMVDDPDHVLIENVAVEPELQGRGYGRLLLAHAEDVARSAAKPLLRLYTNALFAENIRLYATIGFRIDREESFRGGRIVHMSKSIETNASSSC